MKRYLQVFLLAVFSLSTISCASVSKEQFTLKEALQEARAKNFDYAFLKLQEYLREYPASRHTKEVKFAIAEHYLLTKNYTQAIPALSDYVIEFASDNSSLFARMLLYKALSDYNVEAALVEKIKESFFSKSLFLLFSESKTRRYTSLLYNVYKIIDYVDRIEVHKNNELFLTLTP